MFAKVYQSLRYIYVNRYRARALSTLDFGDDPHQFFLISYPKSGNTWIRFLLANLLKVNGEELSMQNIWRYVPETRDEKQREYITEAGSAFKKLPYQFIKTHDPYFYYYRKKKVIYIVRDGRDVLNSFHSYQKSRKEDPISIMDLILWNQQVPMGLWSDHVTSWSYGKCKLKIIIKYEDLKANTFEELMRLMDFLRWRVDETLVQKAIRNSSFQNLQKIEQLFGLKFQDKIVADKPTPFFRKGEVGNWKQTFSNSDLQAFWKYHEKGMREFGYE